jgi:signal transduction histidine kinase
MSFADSFHQNSKVLRIGFTFIALINLAVLFWSGWMILSMPYSGITLSGDYHILDIDPESPAAKSGLLVGDEIINVDGVVVSSLGTLYTELHPGDTAVYVVIRDSDKQGAQLLFFPVKLAAMSFRKALPDIEPIIVGFVFWLVSLIVWSVTSTPAVSRVFFFVGQTAALMFSAGVISSFKNNSIENYIFSIALLLLTPLFLHFYLIFPWPRNRWLIRALRNLVYATAALLSIVYYLVTYFELNNPWLDFINSKRLLFTGIVLFVALASLFFPRAKTSMHTLRQQRLLIAGMMFSVLPLLTLSFLPQLLVERPLVDYIWTFPFLILLPVSYAYAVYEESLDAFDHLLKQTLLYLTTAGVLLAVYFVSVEIMLQLFSTAVYRWIHFTAGIIVMMVAIVWGELIKRGLDRWLNHFFYRHWYDYRSIIQQNSHYLSGTVRLERLAQSLLQNARTMRFHEAALLWVEKGSLRPYQSFGYSKEDIELFVFGKDEYIVRKLAAIGEPCLNRRLFSGDTGEPFAMDERAAAFADGRVHIWVPLIHGDASLTGILLLGNRLGNEPLDKEDWDILSTLAGHISLAVENINLVEALREQLDVMKAIQKELVETKLRLSENRERERLELARLLHDGPIQDIYSVIYQLAIWRKMQHVQNDSTLDDVEAGLMGIEKQLRFFSFELRPPALDTFGLEGAIRSHISNLRESYPDLNFYPDLISAKTVISQERKLALFRIYQEAVQNIMKHARATKIWVRLFMQENQIILEIEDDGVGFTPPTGWMELAREGHLGMLGIAERVDAIDGELIVNSSPGKGTLVRVMVSLDEVSP